MQKLLVAVVVTAAALLMGENRARMDSFQSNVSVGQAPFAIVVNPVTNKIYVANFNSNNLTVINGADNSTATVATGETPDAIAVNPATNMIFVANFNSSNVTVINGANNSTATVGAGTQPQAVAVNPVTNKIYVANQLSNNVTVIDGADNSTATVGAGTSPFAVAVNPVTNKIYVANGNSFNVTVITEQNVQPIPLTVAITFQPAPPPHRFTFTVSDTFAPTPPPVQQVYYQLDTWQGPWLRAAPAGNATQSGQIPTQPVGLHILYAFATEGEDATSTNTGTGNGTSSSPLIGPISALVFLIRDNGPTAAPASLSGQVVSPAGAPLAGVVLHLNGQSTASTITDAAGQYRFENLEAGGLYTLTPELANYTFSPAARSVTVTGTQTEALFTGSAAAVTIANPLDTDLFFVRQQYLDFLGREPEAGGLAYWAAQLDQCGGDPACLQQRHIDVSAAFFLSQEFTDTGSFVYRLYLAALGREVSFAEFTADREQVVGGTDLEARQTAFTQAFVSRPEVIQKYRAAADATSFVEALIATIKQGTGVDLAGARAGMVSQYEAGGSVAESRSLALRAGIEAAEFQEAVRNPSFVVMEYFGYLRRDPDAGGRAFWLNVLNNREPNNYRGMVCSFITSAEYQQRFAAVVTHSNRECAP